MLTLGAADVMAGREAIGAEFLRSAQEIRELYGLVAPDARDRRRAREIGIGEILHDLLAEAAFVIQHIVRDTDLVGHVAGVVNILARAAGALLLDGGAMIIKL